MFNAVVWITGGGTGIGRALAIELAKRGDRVIISGRRQDKLDETLQAIIAEGKSGEALVCDVTDPIQCQEVVKKIIERYGKLDTCIANAGFSVYAPFEEITAEQWRHQIDVNLMGVIWTIQAALPSLKQTRGRLVVISSVSGKLAVAKTSAYSASKFALVGLCNALYQELYPLGVSVTNILPGFVESDIVRVDNNGQPRNKSDRRPEFLVWPAQKAALAILRAIDKRKREQVITGHGKFAAFLARYLEGLTYWMLARKAAQ
ncbi:MAG: SDR family oxidoreductase [Myxococcaceae bacterium]